MNKLISFTDPSIVVDSISNSDNQIVINIHRKGKYFTCPFCKSKTKRVHSKKIRRLQDLPIQGKNTILVAEARLFVCSNCKKRFIESFETNKDKAQRTDRLDKYILDIAVNNSSIMTSKILEKNWVIIKKSSICTMLKKNRDNNQ